MTRLSEGTASSSDSGSPTMPMGSTEMPGCTKESTIPKVANDPVEWTSEMRSHRSILRASLSVRGSPSLLLLEFDIFRGGSNSDQVNKQQNESFGVKDQPDLARAVEWV